jgi:hypothetical protein
MELALLVGRRPNAELGTSNLAPNLNTNPRTANREE